MLQLKSYIMFLDQLPHGFLNNWINIFCSNDVSGDNCCSTFVILRGKYACSACNYSHLRQCFFILKKLSKVIRTDFQAKMTFYLSFSGC